VTVPPLQRESLRYGRRAGDDPKEDLLSYDAERERQKKQLLQRERDMAAAVAHRQKMRNRGGSPAFAVCASTAASRSGGWGCSLSLPVLSGVTVSCREFVLFFVEWWLCPSTSAPFTSRFLSLDAWRW
jgi:hypothetical protein